MVGAGVVDQASLRIAGRCTATDGDAIEGIAIAAWEAPLLGGARARGGAGGRLVTGVADSRTAHTGGSVVEHSVGADEGVFPGLRRDETGLENEGHRLNDPLIEVLDSDLGEVFFVDENRVAILRVKPKSGQPMAQSAFSRKVAIFEAKETGVVGIAGIVKLLEELGAIPAVGNSPTE